MAALTGAIWAKGQGDERGFDNCIAQLAHVEADGTSPGVSIVERELCHQVATSWAAGWQPAELSRAVGRETTAGHRLVAIDAIAAQASAYDDLAIDPRWRAQLDEIGAARWWGERVPGWLEARAANEGVSRAELVRRAVEVLHTVARLPRLAVLIPPPGSVEARAGFSSHADERVRPVLAKVRALLAKAESTEFPDEAEALSAKAQELIARHSIDAAMAAGADQQRPMSRRLPVDDPYADAKALLLQNVAEANRCRAVFTAVLGLSTVLGYASDLEPMEVLYTSLLAQATAALLHSGRHDTNRRKPSFRRSFLIAYAARIGERLDGATKTVVGDVAGAQGSAVLPVLARRDAAVDDFCHAEFPEMFTATNRVTNGAGWYAGRQAADLASFGAQLDERARDGSRLADMVSPDDQLVLPGTV